MENQNPDVMVITEGDRIIAKIRVHRPDLTPEERAKRLEEIRKAAIDVILAAERIERNGTT